MEEVGSELSSTEKVRVTHGEMGIDIGEQHDHTKVVS